MIGADDEKIWGKLYRNDYPGSLKNAYLLTFLQPFYESLHSICLLQSRSVTCPTIVRTELAFIPMLLCFVQPNNVVPSNISMNGFDICDTSQGVQKVTNKES